MRRQDDRADPLGHDVAEHELQRRHEDDEHQELAELDAEVEGEERGQNVRAGELQRLAERERETESVHQAEGEGNHPAALA